VDAIDLFYQHRVDPDVPIQDVAGAVVRFLREKRTSATGEYGNSFMGRLWRPVGPVQPV
jgi:aryl-alcohol dehydrogenase-like predicted oxidoreductase